MRDSIANGARLLAAAVLLGSSLAAPAQATPVKCMEVYRAPHSDRAAQCRANGWRIRPHLDVGPRGIVHFTDLPACRTDEAAETRCFWDGDTMGIPGGRSYVNVGATEAKFHPMWVAGFRYDHF